jgi:hypothetical protein
MRQPIIIGFDADEGRSGGVDLAALMQDVAAELEAGGIAVRLEPRYSNDQTDEQQEPKKALLPTEQGFQS